VFGLTMEFCKKLGNYACGMGNTHTKSVIEMRVSETRFLILVRFCYECAKVWKVNNLLLLVCCSAGFFKAF